MYPGIHNFSEIGKLNKVLLHRPDKELEALTRKLKQESAPAAAEESHEKTEEK